MTSPALAIAPESGTARSARVFTSKTLAQPKAGVVATDRTGPPARQISHPELEGPAEHVSADLPKPLISADVDVRGFPYTPIYRSRLFGSSFHAHASDAGWRAGFTLWLKSWDQCPSGSLPNDDIALCRLAELGRDVDTWRAIREEALHGWFLCADGRLYHPIVTEGIEEAWRSKCSRRQRTKAATAARMQKRSAERDVAHDEYVTSTNITEHNRPETEESPIGFSSMPHSLSRSAANNCASRLPADFTMPEEWITEGYNTRQRAGLPPIDLRFEAERFTDHWHAKAGRDGTKLDWLATWRNWCRNAKSRVTNERQQTPGQKLFEGFARAADKFEADFGVGGAPDELLLDG